jgi:hypothetical protein
VEVSDLSFLTLEWVSTVSSSLGKGTAKTKPANRADVLQYEVVTANGVIKIANECTNKDLFWAMRGGGGAFGVNTRVWLKTFPAFKAVTTVTGAVVCKDKATYKNMISNLMDIQKPLRAAGFTVRIQSG